MNTSSAFKYLSFMWYPTVARRFGCTLLTVMQVWPTTATALDIMFKTFLPQFIYKCYIFLYGNFERPKYVSDKFYLFLV